MEATWQVNDADLPDGPPVLRAWSKRLRDANVKRCIRETRKSRTSLCLHTIVVSRQVATVLLTKSWGREITGNRVRQAPTTRWHPARLLTFDHRRPWTSG